MKINFNDNQKKNKSQLVAELSEGSYEDMLNIRKKKLPEIQENIQDIFKDYDGEFLTIVKQHEDENGDPEATTIFIGGVAGMKSQLAMLKNLEQAKKSLIDSMLKAVSGNHRATLQMMELMAEIVSDRTELKEITED